MHLVAEHIGSILSAGTSFNAGDTVATAYPGPDWTEWGWAKALTPGGQWAECGCTEQDNVTGVARSRLPAKPGRDRADPGPGPCMRAGRADTRGPMGRGVLARRVVVTVVAGTLIIAAELAATLSPAAVALQPSAPKAIVRPTSVGPEPGEPVLTARHRAFRGWHDQQRSRLRARLRTVEQSRSANDSGP